MKKILVILAAVFGLGGAMVGGTVASETLTASAPAAVASIGDCEHTLQGLHATSTCYSVTPGGSQHQRAYINCAYGITQTRKAFRGPTVGVLVTSPVTAQSGGYGCFSATELQP